MRVLPSELGLLLVAATEDAVTEGLDVRDVTLLQ